MEEDAPAAGSLTRWNAQKASEITSEPENGPFQSVFNAFSMHFHIEIHGWKATRMEFPREIPGVEAPTTRSSRAKRTDRRASAPTKSARGSEATHLPRKSLL